MRNVLPDISLRQLEYLVAAADAPTWSAAAEMVGVSPSALSQGLAELERRVGVELFEAQGRRRVLRRSAAPVLDHARQVMALTGDLVSWAEGVRSAAAGRVRVGMIDNAAVNHFSGVVRAYRTQRPRVEFRLTVAPSAELLAQLRSGSLDVVVCVEPPDPISGIITEPLIDEGMLVLAPAGRSIGDPSAWGPWVTFPEGSHTRVRILEALGRLGAPTAVAAQSHQPEVLVEMVRMGLGWSVLPADAPQTGITVGPEILTRPLVVARRVGVIVDPAVDAFADSLHCAHR